MTSDPRRSAAEDDAPPGVPGFRSWRAVYWLVWLAFLATVGGLALFSRVYR